MHLSVILKEKNFALVTVDPQKPISEIVQLLSANRIGAVPVVDAAGKLVGILSERDIVRSLASHGARTLDLVTAQLMSREPITATPEHTVVGAMEMMTEGRFRHLPILAGEKLVGIVSIGDVVKARISLQEHEVDTLRAYVVGGALT